jgi:hypothetical protein
MKAASLGSDVTFYVKMTKKVRRRQPWIAPAGVLLLLASLPHARAPAAPETFRPPLTGESIMTNINPKGLYTACSNGDAAAVSRLLPAGNLSGLRFQTPNSKSSPLMAAAARGHTDIVRIILQRAPNTTVGDDDTQGLTPHIVASQNHHADIVQLLADHGANVNLANRRGFTALCLAVEKSSPDKNVRSPDPDGARQLATVKALLRLGAGTLPPRAPS